MINNGIAYKNSCFNEIFLYFALIFNNRTKEDSPKSSQYSEGRKVILKMQSILQDEEWKQTEKGSRRSPHEKERAITTASGHLMATRLQRGRRNMALIIRAILDKTDGCVEKIYRHF